MSLQDKLCSRYPLTMIYGKMLKSEDSHKIDSAIDAEIDWCLNYTDRLVCNYGCQTKK